MENENFHGFGSSDSDIEDIEEALYVPRPGYVRLVDIWPPPGHGCEKYYRNLDPNGPRQDLMEHAQLAIASYNKTTSQRYTVVDIIRSETYGCAGSTVYIDFTAKLPNQAEADAITFRARVWEKIDGSNQLRCIRPITEEEAASERMRDD